MPNAAKCSKFNTKTGTRFLAIVVCARIMSSTPVLQLLRLYDRCNLTCPTCYVVVLPPHLALAGASYSCGD